VVGAEGDAMTPAGGEAPPLLRLRSVTKVFPSERGPVTALSDISFDVEEGEFVCLVGTSGCGKSTILTLVAGLLEASDGRAWLAESEILGPGPDRGLVFQRDNLFPWLTVTENVRFGLTLSANRSRDPAEVKALQERADGLIKAVGLDAFRDALPDQLSGGMRQRAAIARALVLRPRLLLMDEPFGALDAQTRERMQAMLLDLSQSQGTTVLFVTHDVEEAVLLADRIVVMHAHPGRVVDQIIVDIPRPRHVRMKLDPAFARIRGRVLDMLHASETEEESVA